MAQIPSGSDEPEDDSSVATAEAPADESAEHKKEKKGPLAFLRELPALIVLAFLLALLIKTFLVQAFYIPSESMLPTLDIGDRVLVNKVVYHLHPPRRGDIVVFENPHPGPQPHRNPIEAAFHWVLQGLGFSQSPDEDYIKRVIGLPGDTVKVTAEGVYVNGQKLVEPYLNSRAPGPTGTWHVPSDSIFVMGDNRANSNDSRLPVSSGGLGPVPLDKVVGKAFVRIWPPSRIGGL